jgi:molybdenum cofactor cytidylyltransferase
VIRGILLCAGASSRFGSQKLLHPLADGRALAAHAAERLIAGVGNALAVIRPGSETLRRILEELGCEVVVAERASEGMGVSLATAIAATAECEGWVVALGDMPRILPGTHRAVADALRNGALVAAPVLESSGERGHPVGFSSRLRASLVAIQGDLGARNILMDHARDITKVPVNDAGILADIDRPGDLPKGASRP